MKDLRSESVKIFNVLCNFTDLDPNLSHEERNEILWDLFVKKAREQNIEVSKDQLLMWLQEDTQRMYVIIDDKSPDWHGDGLSLFSQSHETEGLKIVASEVEINSTPLEALCKVKVNNYKL